MFQAVQGSEFFHLELFDSETARIVPAETRQDRVAYSQFSEHPYRQFTQALSYILTTFGWLIFAVVELHVTEMQNSSNYTPNRLLLLMSELEQVKGMPDLVESILIGGCRR
jgi:hypothetical protein